jgi:hypothetical protein
MRARSLKSEIAYARNLIGAGWEGVRAARHPAPARTQERTLWVPVAIGAGIGALGLSLGRRRRAPSSFAVAGVLGSVAGMGLGMAWASRASAGTAARGAIRNINAVRDARWLETHPIAYA